MQIKINGEIRHFNQSLSVQKLIEELGIDARVCAVARNGMVVKKESWACTQLQENDHLECLQFMGGG
ncbi:sulfur carrier protein ThiS [Helicobacter cynogastricus]|uniref:sulfur carrier protein ThiS n=1 Tax=Helicobacter cynogastricus TaxID=329937 RepID=UPI000CF09E18|nr:sulfur carrier protein ThiS [Helicobacter cynogastricus]